jgi:assimilatory nitrate reductase catalytic subunit
MFTDLRFYFPDGRARFNAVDYEPPPEEPDADYPYWLTTGRTVAHYLSGNQTRRIGYLVDQTPRPWVEIHPDTAAELGVMEGDAVRVESRRGETVMPAKVVATIRPDTVFIPYHWASPVAANTLTISRFDPVSWIPAYKTSACRLTRYDGPAPDAYRPPVPDEAATVSAGRAAAPSRAGAPRIVPAGSDGAAPGEGSRT